MSPAGRHAGGEGIARLAVRKGGRLYGRPPGVEHPQPSEIGSFPCRSCAAPPPRSRSGSAIGSTVELLELALTHRSWANEQGRRALRAPRVPGRRGARPGDRGVALRARTPSCRKASCRSCKAQLVSRDRAGPLRRSGSSWGRSCGSGWGRSAPAAGPRPPCSPTRWRPSSAPSTSTAASSAPARSSVAMLECGEARRRPRRSVAADAKTQLQESRPGARLGAPRVPARGGSRRPRPQQGLHRRVPARRPAGGRARGRARRWPSSGPPRARRPAGGLRRSRGGESATIPRL